MNCNFETLYSCQKQFKEHLHQITKPFAGMIGWQAHTQKKTKCKAK